MRVLITGDRGYLGTALRRRLRRTGHEVIGLDAGYFTLDAVDRGRDLRDIGPHQLAGCDAVVNLAAICNDACGDLSADVTDAVNHQAAVRLAQLARDAGAARFVQASSCSIYGAGGATAVDESGTPAPRTAYAASKLDAEKGLARLAERHFTPVMLRFATLYGPSPAFRSDILLNRMVGTAVRSGVVRVHGDGTLHRPLLHVEDAARAIETVLCADTGLLSGQVYNVGSNEHNYRIGDLAKQVVAVLPGARVVYSAAADDRSYTVRFDKFGRAFPDWSPANSPRTAIAPLVDAHDRLRAAAGTGPIEATGTSLLPPVGNSAPDEDWSTSDRRNHLVKLRSLGLITPDFRWSAAVSGP
ncbi:Nucleoside-diphosphate-sugar epimerase [Actinacidiphila alni]|uniref:Nucleoside-diphosphate-sugar epimerase n=1 Tax=Actinacidiphila alni TaxID=380248 RepID=A0A1I2I449_9ACTN|nr:SDR family oxidoreductase [Actinacidiphila alni]SFF35291.1 Nucleoside-diphosphate-sugar epimerase [Actinacidiphila alni]